MTTSMKVAVFMDQGDRPHVSNMALLFSASRKYMPGFKVYASTGMPEKLSDRPALFLPRFQTTTITLSQLHYEAARALASSDQEKRVQSVTWT